MHETGDPGRETLNAGTDPSLPVSFEAPYSEMPSNKSFRTKVVLAKAAKQNRCVSPRLQSPRSPLLFANSCILSSPIPQWFRLKSDSKIQYNGT